MARKDEIRSAYRQLGGTSSIYDGMMTCTTPLGTAISKTVWGIGSEKNAAYLDWVFDKVPEGFEGSLLEVPVGTGVLTMPLYKTLPDAQVTCLDYSADMMENAQSRAAEAGISNVCFTQGDVGALPFADESFDIVLSMNGFHAFPDKEAAYKETFRVLKPGGTFCGCFYVLGEFSRTDWFIKRLYVPKGFFTPPFETSSSLKRRLSWMYASADVECFNSIACFSCVK
ncbi:MAG: class I SAM-dependent methyltransferase [Atopobiaceae bacterium]|nr:class I SAM-dependent methyltransferase [Atopobiaceae bacterium]